MVQHTPGKFFVFEGIDGCGKATQAKLLAEHLRRSGYRVEQIDFPQHGQRSAAMVDDYLTGRYVTADEVGPYIASIFYAQDRYDASFRITQWLREGKIVIADRYLVSNIGHGHKEGTYSQNEKYFVEERLGITEITHPAFIIPDDDYNEKISSLVLELEGSRNTVRELQGALDRLLEAYRGPAGNLQEGS